MNCARQSSKTGQFYYFLLFSEWAFYRCFINNIFNAFHKNEDTCNLQRLHNYVQSNPSLSKILKELLQKLIELIREGDYRDTIKKIKIERDKYISHNELISYGFHPSVSYAEAKQFIDALIDIFDDMSNEYDGKVFVYDLPHLHANSLLQYLDRRFSENQP